MAILQPITTHVSLAYSQNSRKMITKRIIKIEIRVKFIKIRGVHGGICQLVPLEMQVQKQLLRRK